MIKRLYKTVFHLFGRTYCTYTGTHYGHAKKGVFHCIRCRRKINLDQFEP